MKLTTRLTIGLLLCSVAVPLLSAKDHETSGFRPLYNGKNLKGWKTEGNWIPQEDGVLAIKPRPGEEGWQRFGSYLWTKRKYDDFVLSLEYKHPKGGNSGVFVRVKDRKDPVDTGIEVQILDSHGDDEPLGPHDCGGIIGTKGPSKNMAKPAGQWNHMVVTCNGSHMKVKLNGEQIIDLDLSESAVKDRPLKGYIGLQDHGLPLWFRDIKIKEL